MAEFKVKYADVKDKGMSKRELYCLFFSENVKAIPGNKVSKVIFEMCYYPERCYKQAHLNWNYTELLRDYIEAGVVKVPISNLDAIFYEWIQGANSYKEANGPSIDKYPFTTVYSDYPEEIPEDLKKFQRDPNEKIPDLGSTALEEYAQEVVKIVEARFNKAQEQPEFSAGYTENPYISNPRYEQNKVVYASDQLVRGYPTREEWYNQHQPEGRRLLDHC